MIGAIIIEGHIQGLSNTRSLGHLGIPVYVIDKNNCIARYSKYCKKYFCCPDYISPNFILFLISLAVKEDIKKWLLLPSNDHAVYNISKHKDILNKYYKIITPNIEDLEKIYDKVQLLEIALKCGVPIPSIQCFQSLEQPINPNLKFPLITKGRNGLSFYKIIKKKALLARDENELREQLGAIYKKYPLKGTFTQEMIPFNGTNNTVSFTAFCDSGKVKTYWMGIKLREHPIYFGTATYTKSVNIPVCLEQSIRLLKELNYTGICEVEYLMDPSTGEYKLIEINARTWLWVSHARACGVNYAKLAYDFVNNYQMDFPASYSIDIDWYNPITDWIFSLFGIIKGKIKIKDFVSSMFSKKVNDLFDRNDLKPGFAYLLLLFYFLKNR